MSRRRHPKPEIEKALRFAEERGWRVELGGSHAWGKMYCPFSSKERRCGARCISSIFSTPINSGNHARRLHQLVANCMAANFVQAEKK
jgi:hypothetical protein